MIKKSLIGTMLTVVLFFSCQEDSDSITLGDETPIEDDISSIDCSASQITSKVSDFDFEANTTLVNVNGEDFPVVDVGEGPVVLLVHGWPDSKEVWRFQIPSLVDAGYRVIAPDLRGFGDAPKTEDYTAYGIASLMTDLIFILNSMEIEEVNLIGHDWGSAISWTMARFVPDRVKTFMPISVGAPGNPAFDLVEQREKNWYFYLFAQDGLSEYELSKDDWTLFRDVTSHPDEENIIEKLSADDALSFSMKVYQANYQSLLSGCSGEFDPSSLSSIEYPLVSAPTLGVLGTCDFAMLETQMESSEDYVVGGNFDYIYYEGVGHWPMLEQPDAIDSIIITFLNEHNTVE